jgi:hypothetical protein
MLGWSARRRTLWAWLLVGALVVGGVGAGFPVGGSRWPLWVAPWVLTLLVWPQWMERWRRQNLLAVAWMTPTHGRAHRVWPVTGAWLAGWLVGAAAVVSGPSPWGLTEPGPALAAWTGWCGLAWSVGAWRESKRPVI